MAPIRLALTLTGVRNVYTSVFVEGMTGTVPRPCTRVLAQMKTGLFVQVSAKRVSKNFPGTFSRGSDPAIRDK